MKPTSRRRPHGRAHRRRDRGQLGDRPGHGRRPGSSRCPHGHHRPRRRHGVGRPSTTSARRAAPMPSSSCSSTSVTWPSVRSGAAELLERCPQIHVLVNNAGLVLSDRRETPDGVRGHLRHQPPRTLPLDPAAHGTAGGLGSGPDRERDLRRPQVRPSAASTSTTSSRPPRLQGHAGLRPFEAGQHPLHHRAGPPPGRAPG